MRVWLSPTPRRGHGHLSPSPRGSTKDHRPPLRRLPGCLREHRPSFTIETCCGPAVERLLEAKLAVFPLNPKAAERFRDRKAPAGAKSDRLDAYCFADALRSDGHAWRALRPADPLTAELRLLCRDEVALIGQRTALVNQLQAALHEYYPTAIAAFDDWTLSGAWEFILAFPTPHHLASAGKHKWEKFLHAHKLYRPQTAAKRMELFKAAAKSASPNPAVTAAKSLLAITCAKQLGTLQTQLDEYRARINELFARHPDHDLFGSLPGAGEKLAPRLLGHQTDAATCSAIQLNTINRHGEQHGAKKIEIRIYNRENIFCLPMLWGGRNELQRLVEGARLLCLKRCG